MVICIGVCLYCCSSFSLWQMSVKQRWRYVGLEDQLTNFFCLNNFNAFVQMTRLFTSQLCTYIIYEILSTIQYPSTPNIQIVFENVSCLWQKYTLHGYGARVIYTLHITNKSLQNTRIQTEQRTTKIGKFYCRTGKERKIETEARALDTIYKIQMECIATK